MNILNATDVTKKFLDETLFDNVKLTLNSGDTIGLVGRNGEGKTTLLRLLCGSESPDRYYKLEKNIKLVI